MRFRRRRSAALRRLLLAATIALGGCDDPGPRPCRDGASDLCCDAGGTCSFSRQVLTAAIVSDPAPADSAASRTVVYVSLPAGVLPDAEEVTIRNPRTGSMRIAPFQDGGFDPIAVEAGADDTLEIDVQVGGAATLGFMVAVPPTRGPVVVRTDPPPKKRDVPLNAFMLVVFSEPIDAATLAPSSVGLSLDGVPLTGTLAFADSAHLTVRFTPAEPLVAGLEYAFVVTQAITDLDGEALEEPVTVRFWSEPPWGFTVSDPGPDGLVYTSLPPFRSYGERVLVQNRRTAAQVTAEMVDGGLDPVAVAASTGDTLDFSMVIAVGSVPFEFSAVVPARRAPVVVRTDPRPGRRDVPPDAAPSVLFSEPIAAEALTGSSVQLMLNGTPVAGTFAFGDSARLMVTFTPAEPLTVGAEYDLVVTGAIVDLDGDLLEASVSVGFATGGPPLPPGTQLAFVRDGRIYLVNSDGTGVVRLTDGPDDADPAWSPDGSRLAFASARGASPESTAIYLVDADGTNLVRRTIARFAQSPSWSPDGQWLAFTALNPYDSLVPGSGSSDVYVMTAADDGTPPVNLNNQSAWDAQPAWSPDGTRIAFVSDWVAYDFTADIFTMAPDGSGRTQLTNGFGFDGSLVQYFRPAWSPDAQRIAVVTCLITFETCSASTVAVMSADGSGMSRLAATIGWDKPTWSPDGQTIAFGSAGSLYWVSADGSALGVVLADGHSPAWRP